MGPATNDGGGGTGDGQDQGDADGLSGLKVKPATQSSNFAVTSFDRVSITMMMWWRLIISIR